MIALLVGSNVASDSPRWTHTAFGTVPQLFSLNPIAAFGLALTYYYILAAICAIAMIEFGRVTGGFGWRVRTKQVECVERVRGSS